MFDIIEKDGNYYAILNEEEYNKQVILDEKRISKEEGKKEGKKEGRKQEKFDIAKSMKKLGIPTHIIVKSTGLSKDKVRML